FDPHDFIARILRVGHEQADGVSLAALAGYGYDKGKTRFVAVGNPLLAAIEHIAVAVTPGGGPDRRRIGAGVRFRQQKGADALRASEIRQILLLLRVRA